MFSISIGPLNLGIVSGILQAIAAILNQYLKVLFAYLNELLALLCPFDCDSSLL